jgi:putative ABC transport system permease protein
MSLLHLILREIRHRMLNFLLSVLAAAAAVGCLAAALAVLHEHRIATDRILAEKEAALGVRLARYEDEVRKLTKDMGFNILILPKDLDLGRLYVDDAGDRTMPEAYAERLAKAGVATINHVLPSLQRRVKWTERDRTVFVMGVRNEVKIADPKSQKPILEAVPAGTVWLGHELHRSLAVKKGDRVTFLGRELSVGLCQPERGTKDDVTVWMNLAEAQDLLGMTGRINAILALECNCASVDRVGEIRAEVARILPDTQVIEYQTQALARAEARNRAAALAQGEIAREREHRNRLAGAKEAAAAVVVPLVLAACAVWIGFLAFANVRERRAEIGILRAIGMGTAKILALFLARATLAGLLGAGLGYAGGLGAVVAWHPGGAMAEAVRGLVQPGWVTAVLVSAPLLAGLSAWLPAIGAARQDPAEVLREA